MKVVDIEPQETRVSFAGVLEKIEILRSTLRWASALDREQIEKLLNQANGLRTEVMQLSHKDRFISATAKVRTTEELTSAERRQALLDRNFVYDGVFGDNPALLECLETAERAAPTELPVLIDGESGTGKELLAKVIHANGSRSEQEYVSVNCGAIPENLIESELFGHKKGSFTGATSDRRGKFESANDGTIFLDEIGELPLPGQVKLLRVLQDHEIQRVGSDQPIPVNARVVAATNRDLLQMVQDGTFREDLYYRLSVIQVTLPPLRERRDEIPVLIDFFADQAAELMSRPPVRMSSRLRRHLLMYDYPGNIRELRNIMLRVSCLADEVADVDHLPVTARPKSTTSNPGVAFDLASLSLADAKKAAADEAERLYLEEGLRMANGRVSTLAKEIGMNRSHLQTILKKHGLSYKDFRKQTDA
ncbi:sigma-54-dependent Fis family transcriptional regulator [Thiorhodococcus mannitoliphagus]|uniref:Sigma-54-dependent Fis family transcriptional regulator n=1 Tax=Thiorhodococcus mannitoliphagus TaxID=329406 RepID=A0A6P1DTT9_9GAMM|nr:sigma-54 dependent transcriptional regulator [Thiorhodococcus mannitoliphagus]NEX21737.1 sigma-54-dependent Fis family transcriptional regulator [Thiorhodococcus mannitoliphagus]